MSACPPARLPVRSPARLAVSRLYVCLCSTSQTHFLLMNTLKVIYHPLCDMNNFVTNQSELPQDGHKCFLIWSDWLSCDPLRGSHDSL